MVNLAFHFFKTQFDRDLQKYEDIVKRNKFNGMSGGRPKKETQNNPKNPIVRIRMIVIVRMKVRKIV